MKILGIDFGLKNIGLALSEGELVEPFGQLKIKTAAKLIDKLKRICLENDIQLIVLGLPEGKIASKVRDFGQNLREKIKLSVIFRDETLTSKEAVFKMIESKKPLKKRKREEHIIAACLILQSYLDDKLDQEKKKD